MARCVVLSVDFPSLRDLVAGAVVRIYLSSLESASWSGQGHTGRLAEEVVHDDHPASNLDG